MDIVKVNRYVQEVKDPTQVPMGLDYKTGLVRDLYPKTTVVDAELSMVEFFADANVNLKTGVIDYNDLILQEDYTYVRDSSGFARQRTVVITWYREDGTPHPDTKTLRKVYDNEAAIKEGKTRRRYAFDALKLVAAGTIMQVLGLASLEEAIVQGTAFALRYRDETSSYVEYATTTLVEALRDEAGVAWLDVKLPTGETVRRFFIDQIAVTTAMKAIAAGIP